MNIIQVKNVQKSFAKVQALKDLSFSVKKGEIYGLLGPNGAGKSTTINILSGLLQIDQGKVLINNLDYAKHQPEIKKMIGVVPQEIALYDDLSAFENLMFWGSLYGIPKKELKQKVQKTLELLGLSDRQKAPIKTFSGGMKRRINIGAALLHQPEILLMDEPTVGIDPQSRNHIFDLIENLNNQGLTIIYSTHYMEEAQRLCNTIGIIDNGKIITQGSLNSLLAQNKTSNTITIQLDQINQDIVNTIEQNYKVHNVDYKNTLISISCANFDSDIKQIINILQQAEAKITDIKTQSANLESIFLQLTGKQLRD